MILRFTNNGKEVLRGDNVTLHNGGAGQVESITKPHKISSTGRVGIRLDSGGYQEFFPSVIGAEWVDREDHAQF